MGRLFFLAFLLCAVLAVPHASHAQEQDERAETEQRLEALRQQILESEQRLQRTRQEEQSAVKTVEDLDREIKVRQALMNTYTTRIGQLERERSQLEQEMAELEREVERLKEQYRDRAVHAYKYGRMHDLGLMLAAESINQMLIRIQYLRRFATHRRAQMAEIERATERLGHRRNELEQTISRNQQLLIESRSEQQNLSRLQTERSQLVSALRTQRTSLQEDIEQKRRDAERLEARLRALIAAEAARAREREAVDPTAAAAAIELSGSFLDNRGRLPWPVDGVVTGSYGTRTHPVYGTRTTSPGVEIATRAGSSVTAVFEGVVSQIFIMAGYGTCVTIRHGNYTTVYGNLSSLNVKEGDEVYAGQVIARAGTSNEPLGETLFFALFTNERHEDPTGWLRRR